MKTVTCDVCKKDCTIRKEYGYNSEAYELVVIIDICDSCYMDLHGVVRKFLKLEENKK